MSSVPDVVQTSQYQPSDDEEDDEDDEDEEEGFAVTDVDREEFFLAKNSKLFSQVSTNTLKTSPPDETSVEPSSCKVVEVKEMEIVKAVAATSDGRVVLPRANFGVQQVPQVVERVEIVEDTETEPESIDTDPDEKDTRQNPKPDTPYPKKELVSILKRGNSANQKDLADLLDEALERPFPQKACKVPLLVTTSTPQVTKTRIDTQSVAEYLVLDDGSDGGSNRRRVSKEVTFAKKDTPVPKRMKQLAGETREDCDSFYGSDKETDDALIFSDDTEIDVGSSSSEEADASEDLERAGDVLDKVEVFF